MAAKHKETADRVFPHEAGGYKGAMRELHKKLRKEAAGFPCPSLHALRRTFRSAMAGRGIVPKVLQGWMGHSKIEMTMDLSARPMKDSTAREMEKLAGLGGAR